MGHSLGRINIIAKPARNEPLISNGLVQRAGGHLRPAERRLRFSMIRLPITSMINREPLGLFF